VRPEELAVLIARCSTAEGAADLVRAIERRVPRPLPVLARLRQLVEAWDDPLAIDDCVRDAIEAVDPVVHMGGTTARALLAAMRVATTERAAAIRRTRATQRRRPVMGD
jgi:hypothetical protein